VVVAEPGGVGSGVDEGGDLAAHLRNQGNGFVGLFGSVAELRDLHIDLVEGRRSVDGKHRDAQRFEVGLNIAIAAHHDEIGVV